MALSSTGFICLSAQLTLFGWTQKTLEGNSDSNVLFAQLIIWVSQKVGENNDFPSSGSWTSLVPLFRPGVRTQERGAICFGLKLNLPRDTDRCSDRRPGRLLFQCLIKFPSLGFPSRLQTQNMHFFLFKLFTSLFANREQCSGKRNYSMPKNCSPSPK